jgi:hypothetical protein
MTMNAIVPTTMPLQDMQTLAIAIAKSALFGIRTPEQALVLMAIAQAEGRHPVEAARDYDIINNRPAKKAEAMLRDFVKAGGTVKWHSLTDELADATFTHPQTGEVRIDWDMKRAATAFGKKDMYTKFPRQMLRSRVVSEGVRTLWPLATSGMYVPEEQADIPAKEEHQGKTIEGESLRDAINAEIPLRAAAAATPRGARVVDPTPPSAQSAPRRTIGQLLDGIEIALRDATSRVEVDRILDTEDVLKLRGNVPADSPTMRRLDKMRKDALERHLPMSDDADLPEVEIAGESKLMAG